VTTTASITPRNLTISALNASKTYGNADPAFSVSYAGFAAGEGAGVLGGHVTFKTNEGGATSAAPGRYAITPSGLTATNYAISFANGTLTIGKAQSAITVKMSGSSTSYGLTSVTFTAAVAPIAPGAGVPSGTVTFMDASTNRVLGRATLSKGAVSCTLQFGTSTHAITASYSGDVDFTASTATVVTSNTKSAAGVRATDRSYGLTATPTALCQH
jgi:hypothetical protein